MVWGCFASSGIGNLVIIDGTLTAEKYLGIMKNNISASASKLIGDSFVYQQDNDPKHTANVCKDWLNSENIELLTWPSQSPDLNPLENLWSRLKKDIASEKITNKADLVDALKKCWNSIDQGYCQSLVRSMKARLLEVIRNKGLWTHY